MNLHDLHTNLPEPIARYAAAWLRGGNARHRLWYEPTSNTLGYTHATIGESRVITARTQAQWHINHGWTDPIPDEAWHFVTIVHDIPPDTIFDR